MLSDVEKFDVDKFGTLVFHIYRLAHPIRVHCKDWEEAVRWNTAVERALLLRGFGGESEMERLTTAPICEGLLQMVLDDKDGSKEDIVYIALLTDIMVGYRDFMTFRNNQRSTLWTVDLPMLSRVRAESSSIIELTCAGTISKLHTAGWHEMMRWGAGFVRALEEVDQEAAEQQQMKKVDWLSFQKLTACEGALEIIKGGGGTLRYFVLYADHMAYFNSQEDYNQGKQQHGSVDFKHVTKVILGNDAILTIKLVGGSLFQLKEIEVGQALLWAEAWDAVLRNRNMSPVLRFQHCSGGSGFTFDFLMSTA